MEITYSEVIKEKFFLQHVEKREKEWSKSGRLIMKCSLMNCQLAPDEPDNQESAALSRSVLERERSMQAVELSLEGVYSTNSLRMHQKVKNMKR